MNILYKDLHNYIESHISKIGYDPELFLEEESNKNKKATKDNDKPEILQLIESYKDKLDIKFVKPATDKAIKEAERDLKIKFPQEYIDLLKNYNCISFCGLETFGLVEDIKPSLDAITITKEERRIPTFPPNHIVISNLGYEGYIDTIDEDGKVYCFQNIGANKKHKVYAKSLTEYLKKEFNNALKLLEMRKGNSKKTKAKPQILKLRNIINENI